MSEAALETISVRSDSPGLGSTAVAYLTGLALVAIGGVVAMWLQVRLGLREPAPIFLMSVLFAAVLGGLGPSLVAAGASVLVYDFFFTEPFHTFTISDPQDVLSITVFLLVASVTSHLTARLRDETRAANAREARTTALYAFTRDLAAGVRFEDLANLVTRHIAEQFRCRVVLLMPEHGALKPHAAYPPGAAPPPVQMEEASFAWAEGRSAVMALQNSVGERWVHISIGTIRGEVAVLSLHFPAAVRLSPDNEKLLDAFTQQAGVALERALVDEDPGRRSGAEQASLAVRVRGLEQRIERMHQDVLDLRQAARDIVRGAATAETSSKELQ